MEVKSSFGSIYINNFLVYFSVLKHQDIFEVWFFHHHHHHRQQIEVQQHSETLSKHYFHFPNTHTYGRRNLNLVLVCLANANNNETIFVFAFVFFKVCFSSILFGYLLIFLFDSSCRTFISLKK